LRFVFEDYVLDLERRELTRGATLVSTGPQVFDTLAYLVVNRDRVVSKDDLLDAIWQGRIVSESTRVSRYYRHMKVAYWGWLFFRCLRWLLWLSAVAYYIEFGVNIPDHLNQFGHLLIRTEFWMFSLPLTAVFAGFFELMMRERAGIPRPALGRDWSGQTP
jgi:hypothetical protein